MPSFLSYSLLSAKERLEKGVFSRWATRSGVGADDCGCHFFSLNFTFVPWKSLFAGGSTGNVARPRGRAVMNVKI